MQISINSFDDPEILALAGEFCLRLADIRRDADAKSRLVDFTAAFPGPSDEPATVTVHAADNPPPLPPIVVEEQAEIAPEDNPATGAEPPPKVEDLRAMAQAKAQSGKRIPVRQLLESYGAKGVADVPAELLAEFGKKLEAI